jgi:hypothetical protein
MLKRSRPPARKEKAHSRVESAVYCVVGVRAKKNPPKPFGLRGLLGEAICLLRALLG